MRLGIDTGFFVALANDHPRAQELWRELALGTHSFTISSLTVCEILVYFYQRGNGDRAAQWVRLVTDLDGVQIVPVSLEIAVRAARCRHSLGLPTVDSVILQHIRKIQSIGAHVRHLAHFVGQRLHSR